MLGEVHSLEADFPEMTELVKRLIAECSDFSTDNARYNALDKEIRELELDNNPIDDDSMHELKNERAELKDKLYQQLVAAK